MRGRLNLGEIARQVGMGMCPGRAKDVFRAAFNHLKIWQADRLLVDPALTVEQVGLSNSSDFARAFRTRTGKTPPGYRHPER